MEFAEFNESTRDDCLRIVLLNVGDRHLPTTWPEQRARIELSVRLGVGGRLDDVPPGDFGLLDMRVRVIEPIQQGPCSWRATPLT